MSLSSGRRIVVREIPFRWKLTHSRVRINGDSPLAADVIVHAEGSTGRLRARVVSTVKTDDYTAEHGGHKASVTPRDVRALVEKALDDGWDLTARGQHELTGPLVLARYEVLG